MKHLSVTMLVVGACLLLAGHALSDGLSWQGVHADALKCYRQGNCPNPIERAALAAKTAELQFGPQSSNALNSLSLLADVQKSRGNWIEAARLVRKVQLAKEKKFGPSHPNTLKSLIELANITVLTGNVEGGESLYKQAIALSEEAGRKDDLWIAPALSGLGAVCAAQHRYNQAEDLYQQALDIYEHHTKYQEDLVPTVARTLTELGDLNRVQGRYEPAAAYYDQAVRRYAEAGPAGKLNVPAVLFRQGETYAEWGKPARAINCFQTGLGIHEKEFGMNDITAAALLKRMADLYRDGGNPGLAGRLYTKCVSVLEMCSSQNCPLRASTAKSLAEINHAAAGYEGQTRFVGISSPQPVDND